MTRHPLYLSICLAWPAALHAAEPASGAGNANSIAAATASPSTTAQGADKVAMATVEVKGKAEEYDPRRDDTASKTVIGNAEIMKYGDTNVFDVLKRAPGVTVIGNSIRMRGLGNGYTQILVNGEAPPPGFSLDALPPEQIDRIEVIRAATAEHSMRAIAGTINIVLKRVVSKPQRDLRVNLSHAQERKELFVLGTLADKKGNLSYYLNGMMAHITRGAISTSTDQLSLADGTVAQFRIDESDWNNASTWAGAQTRLNWKLPNGDQLNASAFMQFQRGDASTIGATTSMTGQFPTPNYVDIRHRDDFSTRFAGADINWVVKIAGGKLDAKLTVGGGTNESDAQYASSTAGRAITLVRDRATTNRYLNASSTGKYTRSLGEGHALAAGWEVSQQGVEETILRREGFEGGPRQRIDEQFDPVVRRAALYAQDEWNLTQQWSAYLGARWEAIRTHSEGTGLVTSESRSKVLTPVAQTLYKFPDKSGRQLRAALTRTYKAPSAQQLTARRVEADRNTRFNPDNSGNPALQPELASGLDLTYEHFWAPGAVFSVGTSWRRIEDTIRTRLTQDSQGLWLNRPVNEGKANVRTLDVELKFPLKAVMKDAVPLDLRLNINRNWSRVEGVPGPHNRLDQQVPLTAVIGADYKNDAFSAGISFAFRDGGPVQLSEQQSRRMAVRRDLEAYGLFKIRTGVQLRVAVNNALGEDALGYTRYQDSGGISETWTRTPDSARLSANVEFKF